MWLTGGHSKAIGGQANRLAGSRETEATTVDMTPLACNHPSR
jgi:hypothetical protein